MEFSVWAPERHRVRVVVDGTSHEMSPDATGWWRATAGGRDYAFLLDDDATPLPDPRSRRQPAGVHAPSRIYDDGAFGWTDHAWTGRALAGSVLYELHVGTFTDQGTFDAAGGRLDHLVDLGIDLVEVMPVNAVDGPRNWGYDGVGWYAVTENYGGPDAFKRFVDACHARGLGVVLDVVHNHLMLFMGEEWGARTPFKFFSYLPDPALRDAVREGRFAEFGEHGWGDVDVPDTNAEATFLRSKLDWSEPDREPHATLLRTCRALIALRRARPELTDPRLDRLRVDVDESARTVVLHRGTLRIVVNLGGASVPLPHPGELLLASTPSDGSHVEAEAFTVIDTSSDH